MPGSSFPPGGPVSRDRVPTLLGNVPGQITNANVAASCANVASGIPCGALAAGVFSRVLTLQGKGQINWLGTVNQDATSRTVSLRLTIDGVVTRTTSVASLATSTGFVLVGGSAVDGTSIQFQPLQFTRSLLVEIMSSLTETDKTQVHPNYEMHAP